MTEISEGNREISPEMRSRAKSLFDKGRAVTATGNFDYGIELFIQGLASDPNSVEAHQELRDISFKRKMSGGKAKGWSGGFSMKRGDDKQAMLDAEKALAFDPGNTDLMQKMFQNAYKAGLIETAMWIGPILQKANLDQKKPEFNKFIVLRDIYKDLKQWRLAGDACHHAMTLRPNDMDLPTEMKNLMAMSTMQKGNYEGGSFTSAVRDSGQQQRLLTESRDFLDSDAHRTLIAAAEAEYNANLQDPGKAGRLVEALERTEDPEHENRAVELLQQWYDKTKQYKYRQHIGVIHMKQYNRMERGKRQALAANPDNAELKKEYLDFKKEQNEFELKEYEMAVQAYPTEMKLRYELGRRMFALDRFSDAISVFQHARNDPKYKNDAGILLGRSFLEAGYVDEADDTLGALTKEYQLQGDTKAKEIFYWRARALEQKGMKTESLAHYSKVAQWDFTYRDVQARIKKLKPSRVPNS